jgi:hypothetical protein
MFALQAIFFLFHTGARDGDTPDIGSLGDDCMLLFFFFSLALVGICVSVLCLLLLDIPSLAKAAGPSIPSERALSLA